MGSTEDGKPSKPDKSTPPVASEQNGGHVYTDWVAVQAYYGPRVALPPYYNSPVAPGHPPPPYMWGPPQPMVPPYGPPYATIYAPGGVYAHPAVPLGSQASGQGVVSLAVSEPLVATPMSIDTPVKSLGNADKGIMKKLKGVDGLAMSIGNGNAKRAEDGDNENIESHSAGSEGSSNGSDGNTEEADQSKRRRSREETPTSVEPVKTQPKAVLSPADKVLGVPVTPENSTKGQVVGTIVSSGVVTTLELRNSGVDVKGSSQVVSLPNGVVSSESLLPVQNEKELKREKRKQSNRESARRSRLRKQAEAEELARRVEALSAENIALKSELNQLVENSQKIHLENAALMEKLKNSQSGREENKLANVDIKLNPSDSTANLLSRVNNNGSVKESDEDTNMYENNSKSGAKFHQLLDNPRAADALAAG